MDQQFDSQKAAQAENPQAQLQERADELVNKIKTAYLHDTVGKNEHEVVILKNPVVVPANTENGMNIPETHRYMVVSGLFGLGSIDLYAPNDPLVPSREGAFKNFIARDGNGANTYPMEVGVFRGPASPGRAENELKIGGEFFPINQNLEADPASFIEALKLNKNSSNEAQVVSPDKTVQQIRGLDKVLSSV